MLRTFVLLSGAALMLPACWSSTAAAAAPAPAQISVDELAQGDVLEVATGDIRYRFEMVNPQTGETRAMAAQTGRDYGPVHRVYVLGATQGRQPLAHGMMLVQMRRVRVGMRLELGVDSLEQRDRQLTAPVTGFRVVPRTDKVAIF